MLIPFQCPLVAPVLEQHLATHPNRELVSFVLNGVRFGFDSTANPDEVKTVFENLKSADEYIHPRTLQGRHIDEWVQGELLAKRYVPISTKAHPFLVISPLGTVPKRSYEEGKQKFRTITHESKTDGVAPSLNETISTAEMTLVYMTVQDVVEIALQYGSDAEFCKYDVRSAFRNLGRSPTAQHCHVVRWRGQTLADTSLNFGSRASPRLFDSVAICFEFILQQELDRVLGLGNTRVKHFLDDFIVVCKKGFSLRADEIVLKLFAECGIPTSSEKCEATLTEGEYLGIWLDLKNQTISLTPEKRQAYYRDCVSMGHKTQNTATRLELLKLGGRLSFASTVLPDARTFTRELFRLAYTAKQDNHNVRLTARFREDMEAWAWFLKAGPPTRMFSKIEPDLPPDEEWPVGPADCEGPWLIGDASGVDGAGFFGPNYHSYRQWNAEELIEQLASDGTDGTINTVYIETICLALAIFTHLEQPTTEGGTLTYYTDNQGVRDNWAQRRSKCSVVNNVLRKLMFALTRANLNVFVRWRRRDADPYSIAADRLSHYDSQAASNLIPDAATFVTPGSIPKTMVVPRQPQDFT